MFVRALLCMLKCVIILFFSVVSAKEHVSLAYWCIAYMRRTLHCASELLTYEYERVISSFFDVCIVTIFAFIVIGCF